MNRFKNILLLADQQDGKSRTLKRAISLAEHNQACLTLLDVLPHLHGNLMLPPGDINKEDLEHLVIEHRKEELEELVRTSKTKIQMKTDVVMGAKFFEIIKEVQRHNFDLFMKSVEPKNRLVSIFFGSTDMHLLRKCPCPVWLLKADEPHRYNKILVALDFSAAEDDESKDALNFQLIEMAASLALSEFCELHIVHAWQVFSESMMRASRLQLEDTALDSWISDQQDQIEERKKAFTSKLPDIIGKDTLKFLTPQVHLIQGSAHKIIPEFAVEEDIDLVVMGTVGRTGLPGFFMGNTAENILNQLSCSVLTIKPQGFVSPIHI